MIHDGRPSPTRGSFLQAQGLSSNLPIVFRPSISWRLWISLSAVVLGEFAYSVRPCDVLQRVDLVDPNGKFLVDHRLPKLVRIMLELFAGVDVVEQSWSCDFGVLCGQFARGGQYRFLQHSTVLSLTRSKRALLLRWRCQSLQLCEMVPSQPETSCSIAECWEKITQETWSEMGSRAHTSPFLLHTLGFSQR